MVSDEQAAPGPGDSTDSAGSDDSVPADPPPFSGHAERSEAPPDRAPTGQPAIPLAHPLPHDAPPASVPPPAIPLARPLTFAYVRNPFLLLDLRVGAAWGDLGLILLAMFCLELLSFAGIQLWLLSSGQVTSEEDPSPEVMQRILGPVLGLRAAGTLLIIAILVRARGLGAASVGLRRRGVLLDLILGIAGMPMAFLAIMMTMMLVSLLWPAIVEDMQENVDRLGDLIPPLGPLGFLAVSLMIGVYEELLFRGFLMTRLRRATGSWILAVIVSTAVFTVLHAFDQTGGALIAIGVLSLLLSLLTVLRRSILPAIITHALFDYVQFLWLQYIVTAPPPP